MTSADAYLAHIKTVITLCPNVTQWDNAAHHPEIATHPHHMHRQSETDVLPSEAITLSEVLAIVTGTDQLSA